MPLRTHFLVVALIVATLTTVLVYYQDDLHTVFTLRTSGEPKAMVGLDRYSGVGEGVREYPGLKCNIHITESSILGERGYCMVWVRGPAIFSLSGLRTSFKTGAGTTVYIDSLADYCLGAECVIKKHPSWKSAGMKETRSEVDINTPYLSGDFVDRVYFLVEYKYEHGCIEKGFVGTMRCYWLLYPIRVHNVQLSSVLYPDVPYERSVYYPPNPPPHATDCTLGSKVIGFKVNIVTDIPLSETEIGIVHKGTTVYARLKFYKAVRGDVATPPGLIVEDISGRVDRWYRWWYRDKDESTMEVLFCRC